MSDTKREQRRKTKYVKKHQTNWLAIGLIIGGSVIVALAIIFIPQLLSQNTAPSLGLENIIVPEPLTGVVMNGTTLGDPNAPAKLIEYADFQCPACKRFALEIEPTLINEYIKTGRMSLTFVPYSFIDNYARSGRESKAAAEAAYCALDQGRFWDYYSILFANQEGENIGSFSNERLYAFAEKLSLNMDDFKSCFDSGKYTQKVLDDRVSAENLGLDSTPTFILNGEIQSFSSYEQLFSNIEALSPTTK